MGVAVWPMVELEADDALASAAHLADAGRARRARCASGRPTRTWRSACAASAWCRSTGAARRSATRTACARSSACEPALIPDYLALVGDAADGYPGHRGHRRGRRRAAAQPARADRSVSARRARRAARPRAAVQAARDAAHRCTAVRPTSRRCAGAARRSVRRVDRAHRCAAAAAARVEGPGNGRRTTRRLSAAHPKAIVARTSARLLFQCAGLVRRLRAGLVASHQELRLVGRGGHMVALDVGRACELALDRPRRAVPASVFQATLSPRLNRSGIACPLLRGSRTHVAARARRRV